MSREWIEIQNAYVLRYKQLEHIIEKCKQIATISTDARVNALIEDVNKDMKSLKNVMPIYENHYEASCLLRNDHVLGFKVKWKAVVLHQECLYERLKCGESVFLLTFAPKIRVEDKVLEYADPQYLQILCRRRRLCRGQLWQRRHRGPQLARRGFVAIKIPTELAGSVSLTRKEWYH